MDAWITSGFVGKRDRETERKWNGRKRRGLLNCFIKERRYVGDASMSFWKVFQIVGLVGHAKIVLPYCCLVSGGQRRRNVVKM